MPHIRLLITEKLELAWERVSALVVQPGVEFGDDFILPYDPSAAAALSKFIESQSMIYEAHSTDYQSQAALREMVRDHFAILKVGPALTNAFREAIFWLADVEEELIPAGDRSKIVAVLETVMLEKPEHWLGYYFGNDEQLATKRISSLSDRIRYYWAEPRVRQAFNCMMNNLTNVDIALVLLRNNKTQNVVRNGSEVSLSTPDQLILDNIQIVINSFDQAIGTALFK